MKPSDSFVKAGLLHSLSGTMAISERSLLDAEQMVIDEINRRGGILGFRIDPVPADGASDPGTFAQRAKELLSAGVKTFFGAWTHPRRERP